MTLLLNVQHILFQVISHVIQFFEYFSVEKKNPHSGQLRPNNDMCNFTNMDTLLITSLIRPHGHLDYTLTRTLKFRQIQKN